MKTSCLLVLVCVAPAGFGQFGGRPGETVVYLMSSKGNRAIRALPPATTNSAATLARFEMKDPATLPSVELGRGFPPEFTHQNLHEEPDDTMQLLTQREGNPGPHRIYNASYKTFLIAGQVREVLVQEDSTAALETTLKEGADFGPDEGLLTFKLLFWGNKAQPFPDITPVPIGVTGPKVPPGMTGDEYIRTFGHIPLLIAWDVARTTLGTDWNEGVDFKVVDEDTEMRSTMRLCRLRKGAQTPWFSISGSTHLYVLQGSLQLTVPGAGVFNLPANRYAFIPDGLAFGLSNPKPYEGPQAK